ncbi:hypothetical protein [Labrenzia sp. 011]|uniref:hypothetical protein n=1 Tax=Labrenzia sp. 011 TaxID=2171494 RepID=UPI00197C520B|nr:hypothetical protein [Labrenzia sp. 011]
MNRSDKVSGRLKLPRNPLFRLLLINGLAGIAIAGLVLGGIFWANIGNLRVLVLNSADPVVPVVMLAIGLVITLGSVVMGSAVMLLGENDNERPPTLRAKRFPLQNDPQPIPVAARGQHRRDI